MYIINCCHKQQLIPCWCINPINSHWCINPINSQSQTSYFETIGDTCILSGKREKVSTCFFIQKHIFAFTRSIFLSPYLSLVFTDTFLHSRAQYFSLLTYLWFPLIHFCIYALNISLSLPIFGFHWYIFAFTRSLFLSPYLSLVSTDTFLHSRPHYFSLLTYLWFPLILQFLASFRCLLKVLIHLEFRSNHFKRILHQVVHIYWKRSRLCPDMRRFLEPIVPLSR